MLRLSERWRDTYYFVRARTNVAVLFRLPVAYVFELLEMLERFVMHVITNVVFRFVRLVWGTATRRPFDLVGWLLVATLVALMTACVSLPRMNALDEHAHQVLDDPSATPAARAELMRDIDEANGEALAPVHAAASGDWMSLALQGLALVVGMGATHFATVKRINTQRDASSVARTAQDLKALGDVADVVTLNPQPKEVSS